MIIHDWARRLEAKTKAGAVLMYDGEFLPNVLWKITKHEISIISGNSTFVLLERGDNPMTAEADLRKRIRVLVDA